MYMQAIVRASWWIEPETRITGTSFAFPPIIKKNIHFNIELKKEKVIGLSYVIGNCCYLLNFNILLISF